jgi:hypothetical protein
MVMHEDMSYAEDLDQALQGLFGNRESAAAAGSKTPLDELAKRANRAFHDYLKAQGEARFQDAAEALGRLESLLSRMSGHSEP